MGTILAAAAVSFAALCMWLGVRIINRRERWAKWAMAVAVVTLPLLYVSSFCIACWWASGNPDEFGLRTFPAPWLYWPMGMAKMRAPRVISRTICRLATLRGEWLVIPITEDGETVTPCSPR